MFKKERKLNPWQERLGNIIFRADTPAGKLFDVVLLWVILLSILAVMLESVKPVQQHFGLYLRIFEWMVTIFFSLEYIARIISSKKPLNYIFSFYGIIDLISTIPTYLIFFIPGVQTLVNIRALRLLRVFRILKLTRYLQEANLLLEALKESRHKITVFLFTLFTLMIIMGTLMYLVEGSENGFTSIPRAIYWTIVTLTTVGFGDITPNTVIGQLLASILMILGYAIIAAGIFSMNLSTFKDNKIKMDQCDQCGQTQHLSDAYYCRKCGAKLQEA